MPISKERKKLYPANWPQISAQVKILAGNKCEVCDAMNGKPHPVTKSKVVLTVHHMDFNPQNNLEYNLIALCQRCHIRLDAKYKAYKRKLKKLAPGGLIFDEKKHQKDVENILKMPQPFRTIAAAAKFTALHYEKTKAIDDAINKALAKKGIGKEEHAMLHGEVCLPFPPQIIDTPEMHRCWPFLIEETKKQKRAKKV